MDGRKQRDRRDGREGKWSKREDGGERLG